jgi:hypothetical protein
MKGAYRLAKANPMTFVTPLENKETSGTIALSVANLVGTTSNSCHSDKRREP